MNNIYKVIWSKAKNCYVVASEIARSHTKSASGSEKIGGVTRRSLLASLMALSLLCGGLGVASATLEVVNQKGATGTTTIYTREEVDLALAAKGAADDVATNKADIATLKNAVGGVGSGLTKDVEDQKAAIAVNTEKIDTNKANITALQSKLANKANKDEVTTALEGKADKTTVNRLVGHVGDLETTVGNASKGLVKEVNELKTQGATLNSALGNKADQAALDTANGKITDLQKKTVNLSADGKSLTDMDKVETDALKVTGQISNGTVNTTLADIKASMTQTETNKGDIATNKANIATNTTDINELKTKTTNQQTAINGLNEKTTQISYDAANHITSVNGMKVGQQVDMGGKNLTNVGTINGIQLGTKEGGNYISQDGSIWGNMKEVDTQVGKNAEAIGGNTTAIAALDTKVGKIDDRTGGISRNAEDTQTTIEGSVKVDNQGNVKDVKDLSAETITTKGDAAIGGKLGVTGETTLNGELTAKKNATFEKAVTVQKDLTVDGKLNVDKISMKNDELKNGKKHDSATTITADEISNLAKVTEQGNTTESQFTHNEKGTFNYAKDGNTTDWKESTSNVTANGVANKMTDSDGNTHTYYQTATESKEQLVNGDKSKSNFEKKTAEGNTISITEKDADGNLKSSLTNTQTVNGEKTSVTNEDSSSTINQGADQIRYNVTSKDENKTSSSIEVKADGITNTSKDGTITNTAKNVTNVGTESVTNKVDANEVTVSKDGVDIKAEAGKTITESVGTDTSRTMTDGRIIDKAGDMTVTTDKTTGTTFGNGTPKDTTVINGGTIGTNKVNANETNTKKLTAGADDGADGGRLTVDATDGVKGSYKSGDYTSRSYILANTLMSGVDNGKKPTDADFVGSRTDHYMEGNKAKLDETVKDAAGSNVTNKTSTGTVTTITDGTTNTTTKTEQGVKDITNTAKDGTITNDAKDIVNNAQETITNKAGTSITNQVKDSIVTTDVDGTTFENKTAAVSDGGTTTTKINGNRINTGRVDANELGVSDVDGTNTADLSVKAGEDGGVKASASKGTTKGSLDVTAEEVGSTVKDDASGNSSTFKQRIDKIMGNVKTDAGESEVTQKGDDITSVVGKGEATNSRVTQKKDSLEAMVTDGTNINDSYDTANASAKELTDGTNTSKQQQTASLITTGVKDGAGNENASAATATSSANTIKSGSKANTVISTADGTSFINSDAMTPVTGASGAGDARNTTIKGNTINTGMVTMDYAKVMKDLGVTGNAKVGKNLEVTGKTTTGSLEVTGTSTLKGEVTMGSNATVKGNFYVEGTTNLKGTNVDGQLDVTQKATFHGAVDIAKDLSVGGNVTAKSYKVGDKTYIDANGIHANNQKITNVADGSISEGSKDAVNGGQLYGMKMDLEHKVDKVGANAAAMANLHPMEFDPDSKWNIAAAMGNYGSETATAIGAFYRPNEDVMVNFSTAFGTGENMVGGGVSVRLGKGSNKLSREESNALKDQVDDLTARMDALLSVLNPNMSKDFPDVPENHWAYEAVSRLAGNDIVQGYPDGEFHGDRTMTRYEMAEIIYNALSRGAEAERELVEEFKPELQAMAASEKATAERAEG